MQVARGSTHHGTRLPLLTPTQTIHIRHPDGRQKIQMISRQSASSHGCRFETSQADDRCPSMGNNVAGRQVRTPEERGAFMAL